MFLDNGVEWGRLYFVGCRDAINRVSVLKMNKEHLQVFVEDARPCVSTN